MDQNRSNLAKIGVIVVFSILVITGLTYVNYQFSLNNPGGNDYLARWNGAHEWLMNGNNPYSDQVSETAQRMIYGRLANPDNGEDIAHFVYPLYSNRSNNKIPFLSIHLLPLRVLLNRNHRPSEDR